MHRFQLVLHVFRRCVMGLFSVKSKKEAKRSKGKTSACDARKGGVTIYLFLSLSLSHFLFKVYHLQQCHS